jgi:hypothetical protein
LVKLDELLRILFYCCNSISIPTLLSRATITEMWGQVLNYHFSYTARSVLFVCKVISHRDAPACPKAILNILTLTAECITL